MSSPAVPQESVENPLESRVQTPVHHNLSPAPSRTPSRTPTPQLTSPGMATSHALIPTEHVSTATSLKQMHSNESPSPPQATPPLAGASSVEQSFTASPQQLTQAPLSRPPSQSSLSTPVSTPAPPPPLPPAKHLHSSPLVSIF